jgi:hypothetical protein
MSTVIMNNVASVDGFIADAKDQVGPLFDWYVNGDVEIIDGGQLKVSQASADYVKTMWAGIGSMGAPRGFTPFIPGSVRRRTTSSAMWPRRSQRPRSSPGSAPSPWRRATSVGRHSPSAW